jgi:hypothetical protein
MASFGVAIPIHRGSTLLARSMLSLAQRRFDGDLHVVVAVNDRRADSLVAAVFLAVPAAVAVLVAALPKH